MATFITAVYVNHDTKKFSATSRSADHSHWTKMDRDEAEKGYVRHDIGMFDNKNDSVDAKAVVASMYRGFGYEQVTRPATY